MEQENKPAVHELKFSGAYDFVVRDKPVPAHIETTHTTMGEMQQRGEEPPSLMVPAVN